MKNNNNENRLLKYKPDFSIKALKKWIFDYKFFNILSVVALVLVGTTLWMNRPNSMRTPNFKNTIDYSHVEGSYNFDEIYEQMNLEKGMEVKTYHYKASEDYCYSINDVSICVEGYELFETKKDVSLLYNYKVDKTKYFLLAKIDIKNDREGAIDVSELYSLMNDEYESSNAVRDDDIKIPSNYSEIRYDNRLVIESKETHSGFVLYALSPSAFRQLYFDGSSMLEFPVITEKAKLDTHSLFTLPSVIELPIVKEIEDKHLASVNNLPIDSFTRIQGFTTVENRVTPNVTMVNADETISIELERMESGYFEYRPEYIAKRRYRSSYQGKQYYQTVKIKFTNLSSTVMNTSSLTLAVDHKSNSFNRTGYPVTRGINVGPGETVDLIFNYHDYSESQVDFISKNVPYRLVLASESREVLLEGNFELEE